MKDAIERTKCHLPEVRTKVLWSPHQVSSSVVLGHIANTSSELEIDALARSARHFMENLLKRLGVGGKTTLDALEGGVHPIFLVLQI